MKLSLDVQKNNVIYSFGFLNNGNFDKIIFDNEFVIDLFKINNHVYYFRCFFYRNHRLYDSHVYKAKTELYSAVQNILKEELYDVQQFYFDT